MCACIARSIAAFWLELPVLVQVLILEVKSDGKSCLLVTLSTELGSDCGDFLQQVKHEVVAVLLLEETTERLAVIFIFNIAKHLVELVGGILSLRGPLLEVLQCLDEHEDDNAVGIIDV